MADFGINRRYIRAKVPMQVLIGFYPTEPGKLQSLAAPLDIVDPSGNPIAGRVAIKSGMAIVKDSGYYNGLPVSVGFRNAVAADATAGRSIYIALPDGNALDVQASGSLVGLDCSDKYEVQTGYFDASITWVLDDPVTVGAGGVFTRAVATNVIAGWITAIGGGANNAIVTGGKTPSALSMNVVQFKTAQSGLVHA